MLLPSSLKNWYIGFYHCCSVTKSCLTLQSHGLQHTRLLHHIKATEWICDLLGSGSIFIWLVQETFYYCLLYIFFLFFFFLLEKCLDGRKNGLREANPVRSLLFYFHTFIFLWKDETYFKKCMLYNRNFIVNIE